MHPRLLTSFGFTAIIASLVWLSSRMTPDSAVWTVLLPMVLLGVGNAFVWAPNSATATRNLPIQQAGAGAGIYNATRQVGAVLGSAAIAVLLDSRLAAQGLPSFSGEGGGTGALPAVVAEKFSDAMAQTMLLPPAALVLGLVAVLFFERPRHAGYAAAPAPAGASAGGERRDAVT